MRMMPPDFDLKSHLENLRSLSEIRTGKVLPFRRREKTRENNTSVRVSKPICSATLLENRQVTARKCEVIDFEALQSVLRIAIV